MKRFLLILLLMPLFAIVGNQHTVLAETPSKTPFPLLGFPCNETSKAEFNSLRPYQAAPCGEAGKAYYCSNNLIFTESFEMAGKGECTNRLSSPGEITFTCNPEYKVNPHDLYVSLDGSNLPILGNTEDVKNSQSSDETLDDAEKVNEYVSWYLSGVNTRAEYGEPSTEQVVNYSGPLQKLLPSAIADVQRIKVIESIDKKSTVTNEADGTKTESTQNHNQIVVCGQSSIPIIGNLFNIGTITPTDCYPSSGKNLTASGEVFRLKAQDGADGWNGTLSLFNSAANIIPTFVDRFAEILPEVPKSIIQKYISAAWNKKTPPLPWDNGSGKPFASEILYRKAYNEWRGKSCVIVPIVDTLVCLDNIFVPNKYADLFQYIPLAETTDKEGAEKINNIQILPGDGIKVEGEKIGQTITPPLYFAHTEEVKQLTELLNKTYTPKDVTNESLPETTEKNVCSVVNIRTNKGDNLFPGDNLELQVKDVEYKITETTCTETYEIKEYQDEYGRIQKKIERSLKCPTVVNITINTSTSTPNVEEIFSNTVADSASIFRRIYPKVEEGAPVSCIADMPTVTNVTYDSKGSESPNGGSQSFSVKNIPTDGTNVSPQLTFPHLGSVYEYFLNGIQTALRPKGYGSATPISGNCTSSSISCGDWEPKLVENGGACGVCNTDLGPLAQKILASAGEAFGVPASNIYAVMIHEGGDWAAFQGQFTDENVRKWSNSEDCGGEPMPSCDNDSDLSQAPFGFLKKWFYNGDGTSSLWTAVQVIDPSRDTKEKVSRCNFLDAAFATAKALKQGSSMTVSGNSCGSYSFNLIQPASCSSWTDAKVAQSQVGYAGQCPNNATYENVPYTIEDVVSWERAARCQ